MTLVYPTRPRFFANKVIRLLGKTCAAQEIGATGVLLVTWVAITEDASHYRRAVTFFNGQLMPIVGTDSEKTLVTARTKAVEAGWLVYEQGGKGRAGRYFVTIPDHAAGLDDAPSDEGHDNGSPFVPQNLPDNGSDKYRESDGTSTGQVQDKGGSFLPVPSPVPDLITNANGSADPGERRTFLTNEGSPAFQRFWEIYPKRVKQFAAWEHWQAQVYVIGPKCGRTDELAEEFLIAAATEFSLSPSGQDPPTGATDYRLDPHKWLQTGSYLDDASAWQVPNGVKPEKKPRSKNKDVAAVERFFAERGLGNGSG